MGRDPVRGRSRTIPTSTRFQNIWCAFPVAGSPLTATRSALAACRPPTSPSATITRAPAHGSLPAHPDLAMRPARRAEQRGRLDRTSSRNLTAPHARASRAPHRQSTTSTPAMTRVPTTKPTRASINVDTSL